MRLERPGQDNRARPRGRGASTVEYALGAGVLVALLLVGFDALKGDAADAYGRRSSLVATGVPGEAAPTSPTPTPTTGAGPEAPPTLPPPLSTTTTTEPPPDPEPEPPPDPEPPVHTVGLQAAAVAGHPWWSVEVTLTVDPPAAGSVQGNATRSNGQVDAWSCTLEAGSCSVTIGGLHKNHVAHLDVAVTGAQLAGDHGPLPGPVRAVQP